MKLDSLKQTLLNTVYVAAVSTVVTVLVNHYEQVTGKSVVTLLKDAVNPKDSKGN